jgi:hypothetical protein
VNLEPRYWIDTPVVKEDLAISIGGSPLGVEGWYPVVDEARGGIIAYFGREEDAEEYIENLGKVEELQQELTSLYEEAAGESL